MTTDLKALRNEMADAVTATLLLDWPAHQRLTANIESALLAYAAAVLDAEPSEGMEIAGTLHDTEDENSDIGADCKGIWSAMSAARRKEIE